MSKPIQSPTHKKIKNEEGESPQRLTKVYSLRNLKLKGEKTERNQVREEEAPLTSRASGGHLGVASPPSKEGLGQIRREEDLKKQLAKMSQIKSANEGILKKKIVALEAKLMEVKDGQGIDSHSDEIRNLNKKIEKLVKENDSLHKAYLKAESELQEAESNCKKLGTIGSQLAATRLELANAKLEIKNAKKSKEDEQKDSKIKELHKQLESMSSEYHKLAERFQTQQERLEQCQAICEENCRDQVEIENLKCLVKFLQEKSERGERELAMKQELLQSEEQRRALFQAEVDQLRGKLKEQDERIAELKQANTAISQHLHETEKNNEDLSTIYQQLQKSHFSALGQTDILKRQIEGLNKVAKEFESEICQVIAQRDILKEMADLKNREINQLGKSKTIADQTILKLELEVLEMKEAEHSVKQASAEIMAELMEQIQGLENQNEEFRAILTAKQKAIDEMQEEKNRALLKSQMPKPKKIIERKASLFRSMMSLNTISSHNGENLQFSEANLARSGDLGELREDEEDRVELEPDGGLSNCEFSKVT